MKITKFAHIIIIILTITIIAGCTTTPTTQTPTINTNNNQLSELQKYTHMLGNTTDKLKLQKIIIRNNEGRPPFTTNIEDYKIANNYAIIKIKLSKTNNHNNNTEYTAIIMTPHTDGVVRIIDYNNQSIVIVTGRRVNKYWFKNYFAIIKNPTDTSLWITIAVGRLNHNIAYNNYKETQLISIIYYNPNASTHNLLGHTPIFGIYN